MKEITLEELLEAGCHFGHQVTRSNPKARDYVFESRDNIQIIDLAKTKEGLDASIKFIRDLGSRNGSLMVVGTKRQAKELIDSEVKRAREQISGKVDNKIFHVIERWIGGTFTNFAEVSKNLQKLKDISARLVSQEERSKYTKKEIGQWQKEKQKLEKLYGGFLEMKLVPDAIFIVDSHLERLAVDEAGKMGVTSVAVTDTNADPHIIDYPIPANDDATGSIKLIVKAIIDAWIEGRQEGVKKEEKAAKDAESAAQKAEAKVVKDEAKPKTEVKKVKLVLNPQEIEKPKDSPTSPSSFVKTTKDKKVSRGKKETK